MRKKVIVIFIIFIIIFNIYNQVVAVKTWPTNPTLDDMVGEGLLYIHGSSTLEVLQTAELHIKEEGIEKPYIENATKVIQNMYWYSSDPNIVKVSTSGSVGSKKITMTGITGGTATIKVEFDDQRKNGQHIILEKKVTVKGMNMNVNTAIPSSDATVEEIYEFMVKEIVDADNKPIDLFDAITLDKLEKWKQTFEKNAEENGEEANARYTAVIEKIDLRIKELKGEDTGGETSSEKDDEIIHQYGNEFNVSIIGLANDLPRQNVEFTDVLEHPENYIPADSDDGVQQLTNKASVILTTITNIGMVMAVLMIAIIGIKYMLGSVEEKAEYKKDMIPYLVGAILLFGIIAIVKVLQQFGQNINNI